jgi:hypothetical protein
MIVVLAMALATMACVAAVTLSRCGGSAGMSATARDPAPREHRSWRADRAAPVQPVEPGDHLAPPGAGPAAPDHEPTDEEILAAATVISIAPDRPPGTAADPVLPNAALPPEVEGKRQQAVEQWKAEAQAMLSKCARGADRKQVELQVMLKPSPRAAGVAQQLVRAEWVVASPEVLRALAYKHDPFALQACFQAVRGLELRVPLSGDALAHAFPSSIERVAVAL